ncbi:MAG: hypothetical protein QM811_05600 [Pirellulales bacterium]
MLALKTPKEAAEFFPPLLKPTGLSAKNAADFGQSFVSGNRLAGDTYPLEMKIAFLEMLREMNRRGTYWLGQIQADTGELDAAERFFKQYDGQGFGDWAGAVNLALADLLLRKAAKLEKSQLEEATKLKLEAIDRLEADQSPQRAGSRLQAKSLRESLEQLANASKRE